MRYPDGHKEAVKQRIVSAAAKVLRRYGISGVSIPTLMKRAGLTHGGFYVHFRHRDDLVALAIAQAAEQTGAEVFEKQPDFASTLRLYLSKEHLDNPAEGCVLAALGTDASRQPAPVRRAFAYAAKGFLELVDKKLHPKRTSETISDEALVRGAAMIGALVVGRLVADDALAERILAATTRAVSAP